MVTNQFAGPINKGDAGASTSKQASKRATLVSTMHSVSIKFTCFAACLLAACVPSVHPQSCNLNNAELLRQRRMRTLRANILAQLGLSEEPTVTPNITETPPNSETDALFETFRALRKASASMEQERERRCHSDDFFAKPITSFVGSMSPQEITSNDVAKRNAESGSSQSPSNNILSSYRISLDFQLPEDLTSISRADLLLYQLPSNTGPGYVVRDQRQYVEIRTVIESLGQRYVIEGKYVAISDFGYQVFEITSAAKLWVAKGINGSVVVEVTVYCYSSLNCNQAVNGKLPSKVQFHYASDDNNKSPRVIIVSKNPLEVAHRNRFRRQAQGPGVGFCSENETTCCLQPLTIHFANDLGFNFIMEPKSFTANYCEGYCPQVAGTQYLTPQLFEFLSRLGEGNPGSSIEPCCAGNTYQSLDILMKVGNAIVIEELQQVIVTSCRCA